MDKMSSWNGTLHGLYGCHSTLEHRVGALEQASGCPEQRAYSEDMILLRLETLESEVSTLREVCHRLLRLEAAPAPQQQPFLAPVCDEAIVQEDPAPAPPAGGSPEPDGQRGDDPGDLPEPEPQPEPEPEPEPAAIGDDEVEAKVEQILAESEAHALDRFASIDQKNEAARQALKALLVQRRAARQDPASGSVV